MPDDNEEKPLTLTVEACSGSEKPRAQYETDAADERVQPEDDGEAERVVLLGDDHGGLAERRGSCLEWLIRNRWELIIYLVAAVFVMGIVLSLSDIAAEAILEKKRCDACLSKTGSSIDDWTRPFDPEPIQAVCKAQTWTEARWIVCEGTQGGSANTRNIVLNCIRKTIEAGAGFVLPRLHIRGALNDPIHSLATGGMADLAFHFDTDRLLARLALACPEMPVAQTIADVPNYSSARLVQTRWSQLSDVPAATSEAPVIVYTPPKLFNWTLAERDALPFVQNFGLSLSPATVFHQLANEVHDALVKDEGSGYMGVHLRLEADVGEVWATYDAQLAHVQAQLEHSSSDTVYIACGDRNAIARLSRNLTSTDESITVLSKWDVLSPAAARLLGEMAFDQRAWVDLLVLVRANYFVGVGMSSFSNLISLSRDAQDASATGRAKAWSLLGPTPLRDKDWP